MKKVLFITTSFYPDPYVASVRTKEFCRWMPAYGWKPYVLTKDYGHRVSADEFVSAVNEDTVVTYLNIFRINAMSRGGFYDAFKGKATSLLGKYFLIPDASVLFWRRQRQKIIEIVDELRPDVVVTTGPPHSIHLTGLFIKSHYPEATWIADFRDEFRNGAGYKTSFLKSISHLRSWNFEKKIYQGSDGLVFAIPTHYRWMRRKYPEFAKKSKVILNGSPFELDPRNIEDIDSAKKQKITITVIGFNDAPESLVLARAVARLSAVCLLKFIGSVPPYYEDIRRVLGENVSFIKSQPHNVVMEQIKNSEILVSLLSDKRSRRIGITSKMFEYLVMPVPILLLNPTRPDNRLFSNLYGVFVGSNTTENDVLNMLEEAINIDRDACFERAITCYENWNRKEQTQNLVRLIDNLS